MQASSSSWQSEEIDSVLAVLPQVNRSQVAAALKNTEWDAAGAISLLFENARQPR